ncbi:uncharacterized protein LOC135399109 isoform X2 [Ornithodoros turicata]|uniref:uncharacterized protein LOC135399109 isoform X2 n=1 Tax=Ornithodoros turicata TaxID=34597 RepID=UPI003139606E
MEKTEIYCVYDPRSPSQQSQQFTAKDIPLGLCTAVVYCCLGISDKTHNLTSYNHAVDTGVTGMGAFLRIVRRKAPSVKRYAALGGKSTDYVQLMRAIKDKRSRELFVLHIIEWLTNRKTSFDGMVVDIVEPDRMPKPDVLDAFLFELSSKVKHRDIIVTLPFGHIAEHRYFQPFSYRKARYLIKTSHRFTRPAIGICPNPTRGGPYHSFQKVVKETKKRHKKNWSTVLREKTLFTISFSGYSYTVKNASLTTAAVEKVESYNVSTYADICKKVVNHSWSHKYIGETGCLTAWAGKHYISSLSPKSFASLEDKNKIRGIVVFDLDKDDFRGVCGEPYPLMRALDDALNRAR